MNGSKHHQFCGIALYQYVLIANSRNPHSPDRWLHDSPYFASVPGLYSNLMTFLGGPRSCIGFKFALVEYVLVYERIPPPYAF